MPLLRHAHRTPRLFRLFRANSQAAHFLANRTILYREGEEFFAALFAACQGASSSICLEFYIVRADRLGRELAAVLAAAAARSVEVSLVYDAIGCLETPGSFFRDLERQGVRCRPFNPISAGLRFLDQRDHRKLVVVDGRSAFTGGLNVAEQYAGSHGRAAWRDLGIRIEGPAVAELQRLFAESWQRTGGAPLDPSRYYPELAPMGEDELLIISGGPHHNRSYIRNAFRTAIARATSAISIVTPYFVPGPLLVRSLLRAAKRGVRVQLILPAVNDVPLVRLYSRSFYAPLLRAGVEIHERQERVLHAKVMTIDDDWTVIGSANLDQRSFHRNFEINVIVVGRGFGDQVASLVADDLARSRPVTLAEHERRGPLVRLAEFLLSPLSRFL